MIFVHDPIGSTGFMRTRAKITWRNIRNAYVVKFVAYFGMQVAQQTYLSWTCMLPFCSFSVNSCCLPLSYPGGGMVQSESVADELLDNTGEVRPFTALTCVDNQN